MISIPNLLYYLFFKENTNVNAKESKHYPEVELDIPSPIESEFEVGEPMKGADIVAECLIRENVEVMFAYPGGASMELHQSLSKVTDKIRVILPRHEQGGVFAAQGYAKACGKVGVCMATSGPGATNLITGIADAYMDSVPLVAIVGQVPRMYIGKNAFQETDIIGITRPIVKHSYLVKDIEELTRVIKEAFYVASSGRPGPVVIDIPKDIQQETTIPKFYKEVTLRSYKPNVHAHKNQIQQIANAITEAKKPVLYIGGGIISGEASEEIRKFAEKTKIPVTTTLMGIGSFPEKSPLAMKMLGMHGSVTANYAVDQADLLLAFGVRFDDRVTGKIEEFAQHGIIVHVDIDASEINKNKSVHIPVVSDIKYVLNELTKIVKPSDYSKWQKQIDEWQAKYPFSFKDTDDAILPQYVIDQLSKLTEGNAIITTGVGQHQMWAAQFYQYNQPRSWITSGGLGSMGFGFPSAMGAKVARPDLEVVDIDGDGSFVMNIQELATAYIEKIPVKTIILNNQHLGMVVQWEDRFYKGNRGNTYIGDPDQKEGESYPDFVKIAEGFNVPAKKITKKEDVIPALKEMLASKTAYLLDIQTPYQEQVLPMIPSGKGVKDMIIK